MALQYCSEISEPRYTKYTSTCTSILFGYASITQAYMYAHTHNNNYTCILCIPCIQVITTTLLAPLINLNLQNRQE